MANDDAVDGDGDGGEGWAGQPELDDGFDEELGARGAWRDRVELVALLLLVGVVGTILQGLFAGLAYSESIGVGQSRWTLIFAQLTQGGSIVASGLVALAVGLVVLGPAAIGRWGRLVLNAASVLGVLVATLAVLGVEEAFRNATSVGSDGTGADSPGHVELYLRLGAVAFWLPSVALAGFVAYLSWRTLNELGPPPRPEPDDPDELTDLPLERDEQA